MALSLQGVRMPRRVACEPPGALLIEWRNHGESEPAFKPERKEFGALPSSHSLRLPQHIISLVRNYHRVNSATCSAFSPLAISSLLSFSLRSKLFSHGLGSPPANRASVFARLE